MTSSRNHHYLPSFYTARWCRPALRGKDDSARFVRYEIGPDGHRSSSKRAPEAVGRERDLNRIDGVPPGKETFLEDEFFRQVDDKAARILSRMMAKEHIDANNTERSDWSRFLNSLLIRFPESVTDLTKKLNATLDRLVEIYERKRAENATPDAELRFPVTHDYTRGLAIFKLLTTTIDSETVGAFFNDMYWRRLDCTAAKHFLLTSDRPIAFDRFAGQNRARILLALSPTMIFAADRFKSDAERFVYDVDDLVKGYNDQITRQAKRFVISCEEGKERFVFKRLGKSKPQHVGEEDLKRLPSDLKLEKIVDDALQDIAASSNG